MVTRPATPARRALAIVGVAGMLMLAACAPEPGTETPSPSGSSPAASETPDATATPSPTPTAAAIPLPTDCRAILSASVLSQFGETPLNDPAYGTAVGVQPNGSLVCLWRDPRTDTTSLETTISTMNRGPALDMLNSLVTDNGFNCYTPDGGTRCEKTWPNTEYPVTDGRTLFWRDDILIDTRFSNLAPSGYTDSIVQHLFPS
jgi:hypothetical protein